MASIMKPADIATLNKGERTRQTILDAAEELFGLTNYDAISMRDIAAKADVKLGLLAYHFGSKEAMFEAITLRRSAEVNEQRLDGLRQYEDPSVEQILGAYIGPVLDMMHQPERRSYVLIMARVNSDPRWAPLADKLFRSTSDTFLDALRRALPDASPDNLQRGFTYALMVLLGMTQESAPQEFLASVGSETSRSETVYSTMLRFITAGVLELSLPR